MKKLNLSVTFLAAIFCAAMFFPTAANAQRRDYLTEAEIELVRDNQEIDTRIGVLARAVERRLDVINNKPVKESEKWGAAPQGTRVQLLTDIEKLLQKAIDDIDDVASRNKDSKLFPKAVHRLADACREYQPQFKSFLDTVKDQKERGALLGSVEKCDSVIEASSKVERDPKEEKKKKN
jgi:delta 1-pyrroline-5-carboxylate dehydrogenase